MSSVVGHNKPSLSGGGVEGSYEEHFRSLTSLIDQRLLVLVPPTENPTRLVDSAMSYALQGGHRWRPLLLMSTYEALTTKSGFEVIDAACAIEIAHCGTIILDDLPFIDNNTALRRGMPPCHVVHGEAVTVYASHLFYGLAERLCSENAIRLQADGKAIREQLAELRERLVEAQVLEINLNTHRVAANISSLTQFYELKSSLFVSAVWLAATLGKVPKDWRESLMKYAKYLGMAYQLADDILDAEGEPSKMGKPVGKDQDKVNYVTLAGVDQSRFLIREMLTAAEKMLEAAPGNTANLRSLMYSLVKPALISCFTPA